MQDELESLKAWKHSRGPIKPDRVALSRAAAINALLVEPIAVLPCRWGDTVRPLKIGIGPEIMSQLQPSLARVKLHRAMYRYTACAAYLLACAQPDAMRHDIAGEPVEAISEKDRAVARQRFIAVQASRKQRQATRAAEAADEECSPARITAVI